MDNDGLIEWSKNNKPSIKQFADEYKGKKIQDVWTDYKDSSHPEYPTEKNHQMLKMIIEQSSYKDSIVMDCFAGSGSTLMVAEQLGRRWIGIDESKISVALIKKRLKKVVYQYIDISQIAPQNSKEVNK